MNEQDIQQLKAKYKELGETIERLQKGEGEFKPLDRGWYTRADSTVGSENDNVTKVWNVMPTKAEAKRLGKIFQAVAEQEHLVKFVNGDWRGNFAWEMFLNKDSKRIEKRHTKYISIGTACFKDEASAERALKLASANLLAYWRREL